LMFARARPAFLKSFIGRGAYAFRRRRRTSARRGYVGCLWLFRPTSRHALIYLYIADILKMSSNKDYAQLDVEDIRSQMRAYLTNILDAGM
jgi:hypothetical protein